MDEPQDSVPFSCGLFKLTVLSKKRVGRQPKRFWSFIRWREQYVIPASAQKCSVVETMMEILT